MARKPTEPQRKILRHARETGPISWDATIVGVRTLGACVRAGWLATVGDPRRASPPLAITPQGLTAIQNDEGNEESWPEGIRFIHRPSTPEMKRKMIRAMKQFLEDDRVPQGDTSDEGN